MNRSDDNAMKCGDEGACDCSSLGTNVELRLETWDMLQEALSSFERTGENIKIILGMRGFLRLYIECVRVCV
jgi:hypothetical protein